MKFFLKVFLLSPDRINPPIFHIHLSPTVYGTSNWQRCCLTHFKAKGSSQTHILVDVWAHVVWLPSHKPFDRTCQYCRMDQDNNCQLPHPRIAIKGKLTTPTPCDWITNTRTWRPPSYRHCTTRKGKAVTAHARKAYRGRRGIAPLTINLSGRRGFNLGKKKNSGTHRMGDGWAPEGLRKPDSWCSKERTQHGHCSTRHIDEGRQIHDLTQTADQIWPALWC